MWGSRERWIWAPSWKEGVVDGDRIADVFEGCKELVVKGGEVRGYKGCKARGIADEVKVKTPFGPTGLGEGARAHGVTVRRAEAEGPGGDGGECAEGGVRGDGVMEVGGGGPVRVDEDTSERGGGCHGGGNCMEEGFKKVGWFIFRVGLT